LAHPLGGVVLLTQSSIINNCLSKYIVPFNLLKSFGHVLLAYIFHEDIQLTEHVFQFLVYHGAQVHLHAAQRSQSLFTQLQLFINNHSLS
ncbi:hypothetical protein GW891_02345, partial [bacterium]|nr:hypothetical protein [bacterium]